jgi:hypothetical protein
MHLPFLSNSISFFGVRLLTSWCSVIDVLVVTRCRVLFLDPWYLCATLETSCSSSSFYFKFVVLNSFYLLLRKSYLDTCHESQFSYVASRFIFISFIFSLFRDLLMPQILQISPALQSRDVCD